MFFHGCHHVSPLSVGDACAQRMLQPTPPDVFRVARAGGAKVSTSSGELSCGIEGDAAFGLGDDAEQLALRRLVAASNAASQRHMSPFYSHVSYRRLLGGGLRRLPPP